MRLSISSLNLLSSSAASADERVHPALRRPRRARHLISLAAALVVSSLGLSVDAMAAKKSALIKGCQDRLIKCSTRCIEKYAVEGVHQTKAERICNKNCLIAHDSCIERVNNKSEERAATLPTGLNPKGDKNPRCTPGVTCIPPVGGGLLDLGPGGFGTRGPAAATGAPLSTGRGSSPPPGQIK
jgi:hypothetical protein